MMKLIDLSNHRFSSIKKLRKVCLFKIGGILSILQIILLFNFPCTKSWAAVTEEQEEKEEKKQTPLPLRSEQQAGTSTEKNASESKMDTRHSGPQWGLDEEEIEYLFKNSKDFVCIFEPGGRFKRLNQSWEYFLGWTMKELLETPYINFVHPQDVEKTLEYEKNFTAAGLVNRFRCKNGSWIWLDWIGLSRTRELTITEEDAGHPLTIARDVTLHKSIETQFQEKIQSSPEIKWYERQKILEALTEIQSTQISSIFDRRVERDEGGGLKAALQKLIILSNSEFGFISEMEFSLSDKLAVHYIWWRNCASGEEGVDIFDRCEEVSRLEEDLTLFAENTFLNTKDPLIINEDMSTDLKEIKIPPGFPQLKSFLGVPLITKSESMGMIGLFNSSQEYTKNLVMKLDPIFILSAHIISYKKMQRSQVLQEEALARQKHAEAENQSKSRFLAHMSHEIRTPLTGLLGMVNLASKEKISEKAFEYLQIAQGSGLSLLSILNDILDISKIEAGQLKIESVRFNPVKVAQEVVRLLRLEADKKGVSLKLLIDSTIPLHLRGDPTRFRQILNNLIGNALKFTSKGKVTVSLEENDSKGDHFKMAGSIVDTGVGITPEAQKILFKPFSQSDSSMTRRFGGTGLGLFITKQLCEMMGGDISLSSELGKGSVFNFNVIFGKLPESQDSLLESPTFTEVPHNLPNFRVLVVEDNVVCQMVLQESLKNAGAIVDTASSGQEALEAVAQKQYDVVLMDGEMPLMNGIEATQKIRQTLSSETLPIIGVTAHAMREDYQRFIAAGMDGYLTKPVSDEILFSEILRCCHKKVIPSSQ